jgi:hypothetical protein
MWRRTAQYCPRCGDETLSRVRRPRDNARVIAGTSAAGNPRIPSSGARCGSRSASIVSDVEVTSTTRQPSPVRSAAVTYESELPVAPRHLQGPQGSVVATDVLGSAGDLVKSFGPPRGALLLGNLRPDEVQDHLVFVVEVGRLLVTRLWSWARAGSGSRASSGGRSLLVIPLSSSRANRREQARLREDSTTPRSPHGGNSGDLSELR